MKSYQKHKNGSETTRAGCFQTESLSVLNLPPYRLAALSQVFHNFRTVLL